MNKKLKIFSFPDQHPNYLQVQIDSYKRHIQDESTEFIVINVSRQHAKTIDEICLKNDIQCIQYDGNVPNFDSTSFGYYVIDQYHWFRDKIQKNTNDYILLLHSDMFFINKLNYKKIMENKVIYFNPQYRHNFNNFYMWDGIVLLDSEYFNKNNLTQHFNWEGLPGCDVGAKMQNVINMLSHELYSFIEAWNIYDLSNNFFDTHLNGNIRYTFDIDVKKLNLLGGDKLSNKRSFPYEKEIENYDLYYIDNFLKLKKKFIDKYSFLDPIHIDFIQLINEPLEESFALHFKSGSGYQSFHNNEYADIKLQEIKKIIFR